jgi:hypothetical protein
MNGKPDNFVRGLLVLVVLLLAVHLVVALRPPVGRYAQFTSEDHVVILDTKTGTIYTFVPDTKAFVEMNIIEQVKKQKK